MRQKTAIFLFIGAISGIVSFFALQNGFPEPNGYYYIQGLIFGFFIALTTFIIGVSKNIVRLVIFMLGSTAAYYSAVFFFLHLPIFYSMPPMLVFAGLIGGTILVTVWHIFIYQLPNKQFVSLIVMAATLGLSWYIIPANTLFPESGGWGSGSSELALERFLSLYLFWQAGMAAGLAHFATRKHKNNSPRRK